MFEKLKNKAIEFIDITERNISVLVIPALWFFVCTALATFILKITEHFANSPMPESMIYLSQFVSLLNGSRAIFVFGFGIVTSYILFSIMYKKAKKKYYRAF